MKSSKKDFSKYVNMKMVGFFIEMSATSSFVEFERWLISGKLNELRRQ
jgi:hypothetical protein